MEGGGCERGGGGGGAGRPVRSHPSPDTPHASQARAACSHVSTASACTATTEGSFAYLHRAVPHSLRQHPPASSLHRLFSGPGPAPPREPGIVGYPPPPPSSSLPPPPPPPLSHTPFTVYHLHVTGVSPALVHLLQPGPMDMY